MYRGTNGTRVTNMKDERWQIIANKLILLPIKRAEITRAQILAHVCERLEKLGAPSIHLETEAQNASVLLSDLPQNTGRPISAKTLERIWYKWRKGGKKWGVLIDQRVWGMNARYLKTNQQCFREYLLRLCNEHETKREAVAELLRQWREGLPIPGYMGANNAKEMPYPAGWSVANLMRAMPSKRAVATAKRNEVPLISLEERAHLLNEVMDMIYELVSEKIKK